MSAENLRLGELIDDERHEHKNAVHVAVAPVIAEERLQPGQRVSLVAGDVGRVTGELSEDCEAIGIVDPFLTGHVPKGARCWLFLFPGTITSLRHEWTHPAWTEAVLDVIDGESKRFAEAMAAKVGISYGRFMDGAIDYAQDDGAYIHMGTNEDYKDIATEEWDEFWTKHFPRLTGKEVKSRNWGPGSFFSCSC